MTLPKGCIILPKGTMVRKHIYRKKKRRNQKGKGALWNDWKRQYKKTKKVWNEDPKRTAKFKRGVKNRWQNIQRYRRANNFWTK